MVFSRLIFFLLFLLTTQQAIAQQTILFNYCMNDKGNYTINSTYKANLDHVLTTILSDDNIDYGFYNLSYGGRPDTVNAIGLCRGDVDHETCHSCLSMTRSDLAELCPNQKEAVIWYHNCMLRYSNRSIFGRMEADAYFVIWNTSNVTSIDEFGEALRKLLNALKTRATARDSKYAAGNVNGPDFQTIYAYVQCTPDLSVIECDDCLVSILGRIPGCCSPAAIVGSPSCNLRYDLFRFYEPSVNDTLLPPPTPPPLPPPSLTPPVFTPRSVKTNGTSTTGGKRNKSRNVIIIVLPILGSLVIIICMCICIFLRTRKPREKVETDPDGIRRDGIKSLQFSFITIRDATDNFSKANKLGQGGFGYVYKGTLSDGQQIAVKRLSKNSGQGDVEFKNEVLLVAKLQHRNLVRLLGFCLTREERLLIYEFVPNTSLDRFIFDPDERRNLDWKKRFKIIEGIARGLVYLHEDSRLRIIHRDLKAANILLDAEMSSKISDFGMARLFEIDQTQGNTRRIVGTYGYMAPEYAIHGQFSVKSDIFSFGVLTLEIISGQKNSSFQHGGDTEHLLTYAWKNWREGRISNIIDPTLGASSKDDIMRCIHIGLLCVQENAANRPTMASVVVMLNSESITIPIPTHPGFLLTSDIYESQRLSQILDNSREIQPGHEAIRRAVDLDASINQVSITDPLPR